MDSSIAKMKGRVIGVDPGNEKSGLVVVSSEGIESVGIFENDVVREFLVEDSRADDVLAIEWIQAMGMAVGKEVFATCMWVGRFVEASNAERVRLIPRGRIKLHHCGSSRAKDGNISQALRDRFGQKGTKKEPGFFYGVSSHAWQAFAVASAAIDVPSFEGEIQFTKGDEA